MKRNNYFAALIIWNFALAFIRFIEGGV